MVEIYRSEEEQLDAIKRWWQDNGIAITVGIVLSIALVAGWRFWQDYRQDQIEGSSALYEEIVNLTRPNITALPDKKKIQELAEQLKSDYSSTAYVVLGALFVAKLAVETSDLETAEKELQWILAHRPEAPYYWTTKLRLARVLQAKNQSEQALALLADKPEKAYIALYHETKGDIYQELKRYSEAREAYENALSVYETQQDTTAIESLKTKLNTLSQLTQQKDKVNENAQ